MTISTRITTIWTFPFHSFSYLLLNSLFIARFDCCDKSPFVLSWLHVKPELAPSFLNNQTICCVCVSKLCGMHDGKMKEMKPRQFMLCPPNRCVNTRGSHRITWAIFKPMWHRVFHWADNLCFCSVYLSICFCLAHSECFDEFQWESGVWHRVYLISLCISIATTLRCNRCAWLTETTNNKDLSLFHFSNEIQYFKQLYVFQHFSVVMRKWSDGNLLVYFFFFISSMRA